MLPYVIYQTEDITGLLQGGGGGGCVSVPHLSVQFTQGSVEVIFMNFVLKSHVPLYYCTVEEKIIQ